MEANVTSPQSEPDQDNSSLQNPSTNPAEAGTTDETRDEDHETSSIEALNWSEVEEEELAAAQLAEAEALASQGKSLAEGDTATTSVNKKIDNDDEKSTKNGSSTNGSTLLVNEEGNVLSTTLLQSINSSVSDEDPQARKLSVIENWASEVTNAVERGEMEMAEDFPFENDETVIDGEQKNEGNLENEVRRRKGQKLSPEMVSSMMSSGSNGESSVDPLSNIPVLDDGPIWNKGPRSYIFQENRRINQKLTFCLLIAVVLAIGLGLGNLVAHQECEADFKASQQPQMEGNPDDEISTSNIPERPENKFDPLSGDQGFHSVDSNPKDNEEIEVSKLIDNTVSLSESPKKYTPPQTEFVRRDEPIIDPKYKVHAETLSKVVHTLDQLSRKIDQFENTTRKLQGVFVIPDEEKEVDSSLFEDSVSKDTELADDAEDEESEMAMIEDLIDAIEQTPNYLDMQKTLKRLEELDKERPRSKLFDREIPRTPSEKQSIEAIIKAVEQIKNFERRFVKSERKRLRDEGKYDRHLWKTPEEYTDEEKKAIGTRYKSALDEFHKLIKDKTPEPTEVLFGVEEEEQERTMDDIYWPWSSSESSLPAYDMEEKFDIPENFLLEETSEQTNSDDSPLGSITLRSDQSIESVAEDTILQNIKESLEMGSLITANAQDEDIESEKNDLGKPTSAETTVISGDPLSLDSSQAATNDKSSSNSGNYQSLVKTANKKPSGSPSKTQKPKKKSNGVNAESTNQSNNGKNNKRDQKQKDLKKQGKSKKNGTGNEGRNSGNPNGNNGSGNGKLKMASKLKKLRNLESNKVFENIKGKSNDKRRSLDTQGKQDAHFAENSYAEMSGNGKERGAKSPSSRSEKKTLRESTNNVNGMGDNDRQRMKKKGSGNHKNHRSNKDNGPNYNQQESRGPRYHDPRDIRDQEKEAIENDKRGNSPERISSELNNDHEDLSSKETQFRQQKQEFNSNIENRHHNQNLDQQNIGKKSKNWQNKERDRFREKSRERTSSWGN